MKYSIWFVPNKNSDLYERLDSIVRDLAAKYNAPYFVPHISIITNIEDTKEGIISKTEQLAQSLNSFEFTLDEIDYTDYYFQTLVVRVKFSPVLSEANKLARKIFNKHSDTLFVPHISLIYKDGMDESDKKKIQTELNDLVGTIWQQASVSVYTSTEDISHWEEIKTTNFDK